MADHRAGTAPGRETDLPELGALARSGRADRRGDRVLCRWSSKKRCMQRDLQYEIALP